MAFHTEHITASGSKVKVSATDTTADYLISKLIAGTNISIVQGNIGGNETLTFNATGGSGFSTLAPTETPNGSRQIFTFSSAVAQPSYIIADGAWMVPTAKDGTVAWTWNAGSKQATMTIPPTDDIIGVV